MKDKEMWGCVGAVLAAIIGGIFLLISADRLPLFPLSPSPSPTIVSQNQKPTNVPFHESSSNAQPSPIVSIRDVGSFTGQNLDIATGIQNFNGVEFETGWIATTQSKGGVDENKPSTYRIAVHKRITNSARAYFLWQASWAIGRNDEEIGTVTIHFANGQVISEKIVVGYNIRDWSDVGNTLSSPNAKEAYKNANGVVDMFFISIPKENINYEITQIDIQDTSELMGVHLWGIIGISGLGNFNRFVLNNVPHIEPLC